MSPCAESYPQRLILELTSDCNMACSHCARRGLVDAGRLEVGHMELALVRKVIAEAASHNGVCLRLTGDGEPLLHPYIMDVVDCARECGVASTWLTTNGLLLDEELARSLLGAGLQRIEISIDAAREQTYRRIRRNGNFGRVVENVRRLARLRTEDESETRICVSFVECSQNCAETEQFLKFWQPIVDEVMVRPLHSHGGQLRDGGPCVSRVRAACRPLWDTGVISWRGELKLCCLDWESQAVVGHVWERSVGDLWAGQEYARLRRLHLEGDYGSIPLCARCPDFGHFGWPVPSDSMAAPTAR